MVVGKRVNMMGEEEEKRVGGRGPRGIGMRVGMRGDEEERVER